MQWLETFVYLEAVAALGLASGNCRELLGYARRAKSQARRVGARGLALVCAALALEALSFLSGPLLEESPPLRDLGWLAVRSGLLAASGTLSVLLVRNGR